MSTERQIHANTSVKAVTNSYFFANKGQKEKKQLFQRMKFSLQGSEMRRQVNWSDLLGLVSQHEVGSLALETAIIEVPALEVQGAVQGAR